MTLTDECIAALPRVEKGIPRDIFAPIPQHPEPYSLDLAFEYIRFSNQATDSVVVAPPKPSSTAVDNRPSTPQQPRGSANPQQQQQQQQQKGVGTDGKFNCAPCKKSFGSEATWNSHQMSAKHIAAVKDAEKKNKGGSKAQGGGQKGGNRQYKSQEVAEEQVPPEVTEALMSFRKVEKIVNENPSMAATVLWKIAKALWSYRQTQETIKVLLLLIKILSEMQTSPSSAAPGVLSPTQIGMTLYLSRLSMARLIIYHSQSLALQYYLDAIQGRWSISSNDFQELCETSSAAQHINRCREYLSTHPKTEKLMSTPTLLATAEPPLTATPTKKPTDPNLKLLTVLRESASMLTQTSSTRISSTTSKDSTTDNRILAETAITLFALAAALSEASEDILGTVNALRNMAKVYQQGLGTCYSAAACLIRSAEIVFSSQNKEQITNEQIENATWDVFQALLFAMDTGDFVRMKRAIALLGGQDILTFQDVQIITEVAQAVISQDNDYLSNTASNNLCYLILLLREQGAAAKSELLICRQISLDASIAALERVKRLVS
ncbi:hypothetical protein FBU30_006282 [Linnemannia zychae]|nr:hypothetical protein FBU30_006282 [Linnemannia zychae]